MNENRLKDIMYELLQNPIRENFSNFINNHTGEDDCIDFKKQWIEYFKIAQIVLGIANSGGGIIVFGVDETDSNSYIPCGLNEIKEKGEAYKSIRNYIPKKLNITIEDFDYTGEDYSKLKDKKYQVIFIIPKEEDLPYVCEKDGEKLKSGAVYIRRGTETHQANYDELNNLITAKIKACDKDYSDLNLEEQIEQLKVLYKSIDKKVKSQNLSTKVLLSSVLSSVNILGGSSYTNNPKYPVEDYDDFISLMIEEKKKHIKKTLDVNF